MGVFEVLSPWAAGTPKRQSVNKCLPGTLRDPLSQWRPQKKLHWSHTHAVRSTAALLVGFQLLLARRWAVEQPWILMLLVILVSCFHSSSAEGCGMTSISPSELCAGWFDGVAYLSHWVGIRAVAKYKCPGGTFPESRGSGSHACTDLALWGLMETCHERRELCPEFFQETLSRDQMSALVQNSPCSKDNRFLEASMGKRANYFKEGLKEIQSGVHVTAVSIC